MSSQSPSNNNCENQNPLSKLCEQLSLNEADRNARGVSQTHRSVATQFVNEFLDESYEQNFQTFRSDVLFKEVKAIEGSLDSQQGQTSEAVRRPAVQVPSSVLGVRGSHCVHWIPHPSSALPLDHSQRPEPSILPVLPSDLGLPRNALVESPPSHCPMLDSFPVSPDLKSCQYTLGGLISFVNYLTSTDAGKEVSKEGETASLEDENGKKKSGVNSSLQTSKSNPENISSEEGDGETSCQSNDNEDGIKNVRLAMWNFFSLRQSKNKKPKNKSQTQRSKKEEQEDQILDYYKRVEAELFGCHPGVFGTQPPPRIPSSIYDRYVFDDCQPLIELRDPLNQGIKYICAGNVVASTLCFEAAILKIPRLTAKKLCVAWLGLGISQEANEQYVLAIIAFQQCLHYEPDNLNALMLLAASCLHEHHKKMAIVMLWQWLSKNPKYSEMVDISPPQDMYDVSSPINMDFHKKLENLLIREANKIPSGSIDADVQYALGLLYTAIDDHKKAADCFGAVTMVDPCDETVWNSLGEAQLHNEKYDESFIAFDRALNIRPDYVRALYNMGITFSRIGNHKEAMNNYLKALTVHVESSRGLVGRLTDSIWSSIDTAVKMLGRVELHEAVKRRHLCSLIKPFKIDRQWHKVTGANKNRDPSRFAKYFQKQ